MQKRAWDCDFLEAFKKKLLDLLAGPKRLNNRLDSSLYLCLHNQKNGCGSIGAKFKRDKEMAEFTNNNPLPPKDDYLREIRDAVVGIHDMLQNGLWDKNARGDARGLMSGRQTKMLDGLVSGNVVSAILGVGKTTLGKWRRQGCVGYKRMGSRLIMYSFLDIMDALANGRLVARDFNCLIAYRRMLEWYRSNVDGDVQE